MAISIASGFPASAASTTLTVTTVNVGDLIVVLSPILSTSGGMTAITDSNSRIRWNSVSTDQFIDYSNGVETDVWYGIVNSIGSTTIQPTWGSGVTGPELDAYEFNYSSAATWSVVATSYQTDSSNSVIAYPSLTSGTGANQLYIGIAASYGTIGAGSTSGFSYYFTANSYCITSNVALSPSTSYTPTASTTLGPSDTVAVIFAATPSIGSTSMAWINF